MECGAKGKVQTGIRGWPVNQGDLNSTENILGSEDRNPPLHISWLSLLPWPPPPTLGSAPPFLCLRASQFLERPLLAAFNLLAQSGPYGDLLRCPSPFLLPVFPPHCCQNLVSLGL